MNQLPMNDVTHNKTTAEQPSRFYAVINSALLIITLTLVFGALSYALIEINNAVFNLSISEGLWCGLAMALVTGYYLLRRGKPGDRSDPS